MSASTRVQGSRPERVALVLHPMSDVGPAVRRVVEWATREGIGLVAAEDRRLPDGVERVPEAEVPGRADLVLALGGDGTMLAALRFATPFRVPVLGANLGRLGFLTEVDPEHLPDALDALGRGAFAVEERLALRVAWQHDGAPLEHAAF